MDSRQLYTIIDELLISSEERIHRKILRLRMLANEDINGPVGASRHPPYDTERAIKSVNKLFDKYEEFLQQELDKIKSMREEVINKT